MRKIQAAIFERSKVKIFKTTFELNLIRYPIVYISNERAFHKLQTMQFVAQNINAVKSYSQCFNPKIFKKVIILLVII